MKLLPIFLCLLVLAFANLNTSAQTCAKIKDGTLLDSQGRQLVLGFDQFGYNYNARMFNGTYDSVDRVLDSKYYGQTGSFVSDKLTMKWSEDWLSNQDCNNDGKLDRGVSTPFTSSRGWTTNHVEGDYLDAEGDSHHYTYFVKIVWVGPAPTAEPDPWAGKRLWNEFAIIEEVYNDPFGGHHGVVRDMLANPAGLGAY